MLSAFAHQIQELDKKVIEQNNQLAEVKTKLSEKGSGHPECQCQPALANLQSQVDSNHFRLNDLTAKFQSLQASDAYGSPMCSDLSDSGPFYEDTHPKADEPWRAPGSRGPTPNCLPEGYESPPLSSPSPQHHQPFNYSAKEFFAAVSFANGSNLSSDSDTKMSQSPTQGGSPPAKKCNPWLVDNAKIREPPIGQKPNKGCVSIQGQTITMENVTSIAAENSNLKQQILAYRRKVSELEEKVRRLEQSARDRKQAHEQTKHGDRETQQRQEWYEHKLKLLKQDKRRRGETIGKLIRVIDELRDSGRLEESRVREGRAVLAATLGSHGLHTEDRVTRVVDAVEYDRVPRTPPAIEASDSGGFPRQPSPQPCLPGNQTTTSGPPNQNKNNSAFLCEQPACVYNTDTPVCVYNTDTPVCVYNTDTPVCVYPEPLAVKHGFRPIDKPKDEEMEMM